MNYEDFKSWPFQEAKKILKSKQRDSKETIVFETGYGTSGLAQIGTF